MDEQRKWFLEVKSTPGEDIKKIVEMTTQDLEYYRNLVDKVVAGFERTDFNFEESSSMDKMLSNSITCYREIIHEKKSINAANFIVVLRNCHSHPNLQ
ncbi:hypothetical protein [Klebsiella pneumoniae]|uniref:hypothetical protein n=1 Tax=Klebsiella pneumoniae TaxID=573 RepID=UPI00358F4989